MEENNNQNKSNLVKFGLNLGVAFGAVGLIVLTILSFVAYGNGKFYGLIVGVIGVILAMETIALLVTHSITHKFNFLENIGATFTGFSIGAIAIIVGIVICVIPTSATPIDDKGSSSSINITDISNTTEISSDDSSSEITESSIDENYDEITTSIAELPTEDTSGKLTVTIFGSDYAGDYTFNLLPFNDLRVYSLDYVEPTYDVQEKKTYTLKDIEEYSKTLFDDDLVEINNKINNNYDQKLPAKVIFEAVNQVKEQIYELVVDGDLLEFSTEGFTTEYYSIPNEYSKGVFGFSVKLGDWNKYYGFQLPSFDDVRFYTNNSTGSTVYAGGVNSYELKVEDSLFELFKEEIMYDFDGISSGMGYYVYETHTDAQKEWFKRCFDIELSKIYEDNNLYSFERAADPSLINQLKFAAGYNGHASCIGVDKDYYNTLTEVEIPTKVTIKGTEYTVTTIASNAFAGNTTIESVKFSSSINLVDTSAFAGCSSLKTISFATKNYGEMRAIISKSAFTDCLSLETIETNNAVDTIHEKAFLGCSSIKALVFDETIKSVGENAFKNCTNLKSVKYTGNIKTIQEGTFTNDVNLQSAELVGVTKIEKLAFAYCDLKTLSIPGSVKDIENMAFISNDNIVFNVDMSSTYFTLKYGYLLKYVKDGTFHLVAANYNVGQDNVDPSFGFDDSDAYPVSEVYSFALSNKPYLKSIKFGNSLKKIGANAFANSENLVYVDLSKTQITQIDNNTFEGCTKLTKLYSDLTERKYINGHIHSVGYGAFAGTKISKLDLSEELEFSSIQPQAFSDMKELKQIVLPDSLKYIFTSILSGCSKLGEGLDYGIIFAGEYDDWQKIPVKDKNWWNGIDSQVVMYFEGSNFSRTVKDA